MQKTTFTVAGRAVWMIAPADRQVVLRSWMWLSGTYTLPDEQGALMSAVAALDAGGVESRLVAANRLGNLIDLYRLHPRHPSIKT